MSLFSFEWFSNVAGYSGNIQADMMEKEMSSGTSFEDRYICTSCGFKFPESQWVKDHNCCKECFLEFNQGK